jgi:uncharacterized repeat protein (TIGR01451 family)
VLYEGTDALPKEPGSYIVTANFVPDDEVNYKSLTNAGAGIFVILEAHPALTLGKTAAEEAFSAVGDVIHYSYLLTNSGNVPLAGPFTITDDQVTAACPEQSSLAAEASLLCTATYTITTADIEAKKVVNTASGHASYAGEAVDSERVELTINYRPATQAFSLYLPLAIRTSQGQQEASPAGTGELANPFQTTPSSGEDRFQSEQKIGPNSIPIRPRKVNILEVNNSEGYLPGKRDNHLLTQLSIPHVEFRLR